jgi:hypothetical protein
MQPIIGYGYCLWLCGDVCHSPPSPYLCPQEPWEAQEEAHRDRSRVKFSFRLSCATGLEWQPAQSHGSNPGLSTMIVQGRRSMQ